MDVDSDDGEGPEIYTLYLFAKVSSKAKTNIFLRQSPRIIIDQFTGSNQEVLAPLWTKWDRERIRFQQLTVTFTKLFTQMASWDLNTKQVRTNLVQIYLRPTS